MGQSQSSESSSELSREEMVAIARQQQSTLLNSQLDYLLVFLSFLRQCRYSVPIEILYEIFFQYGGIRLVRCARNEQMAQVTNGNMIYLSLPLRATASLSLDSVSFTLESRDQGWSSFPAQHGTRDNSNTWFVAIIPKLLMSQTNFWPGVFLHRNIHAGRHIEISNISFNSPTDLMSRLRQEWALSVQNNTAADDTSEYLFFMY